jgi:hypothetical protein
LTDAINRVNEEVLVKRIASARDVDLDDARTVSLELTKSMIRAVRLFELLMPFGAFGFGSLAPLGRDDPYARVAVFMNALVSPQESQTTANLLREATANFEALLAAGKEWLAEHPDKADEAQERGLYPVMEDFIATKASP